MDWVSLKWGNRVSGVEGENAVRLGVCSDEFALKTPRQNRVASEPRRRTAM